MHIRLDNLSHDDSIRFPKRRVYVCYVDGKSQVADFIEEELEPKAFRRLGVFIDRFAEQGWISSTKHCKPLAGKSNLYELKTDGARIFFFQDGDMVVLVQGCEKKTYKATATVRAAIDRADGIKQLYFTHKERNQVEVSYGDR